MKPVIIHFIDTLGRGGAEKLLVNTVNLLGNDFENIVVYLNAPHDLKNSITNAKVICLEEPFSWKSFFKIRSKLQHIIKENKVSIIHSHSYWTNLISRLLNCPNVIKVQSYHNAIYDTMWDNKKVKLLAYIDRLLYKKKHIVICVSNYVKSIVEDKLKIKNTIVLKNFIVSNKQTEKQTEITNTLRIVAIGNIKKEKNYDLVIEAFQKELHKDNLIFHIYGSGNLLETYQNKLKELKIKNLVFMGSTSNVERVMQNYNLYCMTSTSEACPLSPLEALQAGLPLLLSDIQPLKEIAEDNALYFRSGDVNSFIAKIRNIHKELVPLNNNKIENILKRYSQEQYIKNIKEIYKKSLVK